MIARANRSDYVYTVSVVVDPKTESEKEPMETFSPDGRRVSIVQFAKRRLSGTRPAFIFAILTATITTLIAFVKRG